MDIDAVDSLPGYNSYTNQTEESHSPHQSMMLTPLTLIRTPQDTTVNLIIIISFSDSDSDITIIA